MPTRIRFLGVAGYEIESPRGRILIDPFLRGNPLAPSAVEDIQAPDVILVTHAPWDHLGDAAEIAQRTGAPVVCGPDVRLMLLDRGVPDSQIRATVWGVVVEVNGVVVRPVESHHLSLGTLSTGVPVSGIALGFLIDCGPGVRLYHFGDTAYFDMRLLGQMYRPTVGLLGCTIPQELVENDAAPGRILTGEMTPREAASVADMLGLNVAVASHYLGPNADTDTWLELGSRHPADVGRTFLAPEVGQTIVTDGHEAFTEEPAP